MSCNLICTSPCTKCLMPKGQRVWPIGLVVYIITISTKKKKKMLIYWMNILKCMTQLWDGIWEWNNKDSKIQNTTVIISMADINYQPESNQNQNEHLYFSFFGFLKNSICIKLENTILNKRNLPSYI